MAGPVDDGFEVLTLSISEYEHLDQLSAVAVDAGEIEEMLVRLGGSTRHWTLAPRARDQSRVAAVLADWAAEPEPRNTVLVWLGHGEARGNEAWLATHETRKPMRGTGLGPQALADHLISQWRKRQTTEHVWTLVAIEACGADTFVRLLASALLERERAAVPERLAIIGVGGTGVNYLGDLKSALRQTLDSFTDNDEHIRVGDLIVRLEDRVRPGRVIAFGMHAAAPIVHSSALRTGVAAPLDTYAAIRNLLLALPEDQRSHFVPKAQGAEQGELAWYFVGRTSERAQISKWLRSTESGMLIVTGRAGAGKSALLGDLIVRSNPDLCLLLMRAGMLQDVEDGEEPPSEVFDAVVHLTGLTSAHLVRRIAQAASIELAPAADPSDVDWLLTQLARRRFTLLVDALDEAQDAANIAGSILRRIAALPAGRVVVGTRASTTEGPDHPDTTAEDLLDALGRSATTTTIFVDRDPMAIAAYVTRRLAAALDVGALSASRMRIEEIARDVAGRGRQFLFARLAAHEILARPGLVSEPRRQELGELLTRDHRALFSSAVDRLAKNAAVNDPLLEALALSAGRGLPRADRVWAIAATALAGGVHVSERNIDELLTAAAPYIMLDTEDGQSVYRLAHRTFQEHFQTRKGTSLQASHGVV